MESPPKPKRAVAWSGVGAAVGAVCWMTMPWLQIVTFGSRPYVGTVYDIGSLLGLGLLLAGVAGLSTVIGRPGRTGRVALGATGLGLCCLGVLAAESVAAYVAAGFVPVPATGGDPAGLVRTWLAITGYALALSGTGLIGVVLHRRPDPSAVTVALCLLTPVVPVLVVLAGTTLPLPVWMVVVRTSALVLPFGVAWVALGRVVRVATTGRT
ncbi:hypothetical protein [Haloarcula montana]|uniref:hypothetical protein n=1 Tax=Haloarcula montana TaxID=3111776 RepID=UPI002D771428|nr:hypothetical protein [Haloarcula sp. GH36]